MNRRVSFPLLHGLLCLSGFAGLGYEIVWTRMLAVGLGHEILAVLAVIAAFFSGLALGAWVLDRPLARTAFPGRWYAGLELAIAGWSLALIGLIPLVNRFAATLIGTAPSPLQHWGIAFALPFLVLLPATFAMGGTLPAIERLRGPFTQDGQAVAGLYAANTFGAFAGTLLTTFLIIPRFGIGNTLLALAAANILCAAAAAVIAGRSEAVPASVAATPEKTGLPASRLLMTLLATGLIGIGYEVLAIRVLAQVMESTVYTFASALSVYLLGTAIGAAAYQRFGRSWEVEDGLRVLLPAACAACLAGILALGISPAAYAGLLDVLGRTFHGSVAAELGVALLIFLPPTILMGALFSHLAQAARSLNGGLGRALALNTLGAAMAPLVFGVLLLPAAGLRLSLVAVSVAYLPLMPAPRLRAMMASGVAAAAALALAVIPLDLNFVTAPAGGRILTHVDGVLASVSVVADARDHRYLKVDNRFRMGSTASGFSDRRQSYVPLLLHPNPRRALFLGIGTGGTFAGAADFPGLRAQGVELVPEILPLLRYFEPATGNPSHASGLHITVADARRYVRATPDRYDVVISDLFHPARDGSGSLYTREHFAAIRERLAEGGLFCQWLPLYQLDIENLAVIMRTFQSVFPDASAFLAHYSLQTPLIGLVGGGMPLHVSAEAIERRIAQPALLQPLAALRLDTAYALLGTFAAGPDDLRAFAGSGPLNTDDRPLVAFQAPSTVYAPLGPPGERLLALMERFKPKPEEILGSQPGDNSEAASRLTAYWEARNQFLKAGLGVEPTADIRKMVDKIQQPLLAIVRKSPDFDPAYMPLLSLASALARTDRDGARQLLTELANANPYREEAKALLRQLAAR